MKRVYKKKDFIIVDKEDFSLFDINWLGIPKTFIRPILIHTPTGIEVPLAVGATEPRKDQWDEMIDSLDNFYEMINKVNTRLK